MTAISDDAPRAGNVIAVRIRLPHGVTDRFVEVTESGYVDVNGEPVTGDVVSYRYPSADELADWLDHKRETELHECLPASYPVPGDGACWTVPWAPKPTAKCGLVVVAVGFETREAS